VELAEAAGDNQVLAEAETRRGTILRSWGRREEARETLDGAIALAEKAGALDVVANAANNVSAGLYMEGRLLEAESYVRRATAASERVGDPDRLAFMLRGLAFILCAIGNWGEARESAERAVRLSDAVGDSWGRPYILTALAYLDVLEGRWDEAGPRLAEAAELSRRHDDPTAMGMIIWAWSNLTFLRNEPEEVVKRVEPLIDSPRIDQVYRLTYRALTAHAWIELGKLPDAENLARQVIEAARKERIRLVEAETLLTLGSALARQGRQAEAQAVFAEAVELSRRTPYPLNEAVARYEWGRMLADAGDAPGARDQLDAALALYEQLGARPFVERARLALAALEVPTLPSGGKELSV
jgi:tetratricopeptide (TPR) repeat protein